jgi:hypothetical protein
MTFFTLHPREYLKRKETQGGRELVDFVTPGEVRDTYPALPVRDNAFLSEEWNWDERLEIWEKKRT